jgi:hypothetical protein
VDTCCNARNRTLATGERHSKAYLAKMKCQRDKNVEKAPAVSTMLFRTDKEKHQQQKNVEMAKLKNDFELQYFAFAPQRAAQSYRAAMPALTSYESTLDFIACVSHGMAIGAILPEESSKLLYAAQVALGAFRPSPAASKPARKEPARQEPAQTLPIEDEIEQGIEPHSAPSAA